MSRVGFRQIESMSLFYLPFWGQTKAKNRKTGNNVITKKTENVFGTKSPEIVVLIDDERSRLTSYLLNGLTEKKKTLKNKNFSFQLLFIKISGYTLQSLINSTIKQETFSI